jgi:hypothetical protein
MAGSSGSRRAFEACPRGFDPYARCQIREEGMLPPHPVFSPTIAKVMYGFCMKMFERTKDVGFLWEAIGWASR